MAKVTVDVVLNDGEDSTAFGNSFSSNDNVSSYTYYGTGDYQVNYANQLTDSAGNATDYQSVSFCITGSVYAVSGQFAHTHPFIYSGDKNHVRFICHKTENSNQRAEQPYVGVIVFS